MVVPPCRRLWDPRMSRLTPRPRRSPGRRSGDPHLSKKCSGSTVGDLTYQDPHLGQSSPGTPACRAGTPRWYSTYLHAFLFVKKKKNICETSTLWLRSRIMILPVGGL